MSAEDMGAGSSRIKRESRRFGLTNPRKRDQSYPSPYRQWHSVPCSNGHDTPLSRVKRGFDSLRDRQVTPLLVHVGTNEWTRMDAKAPEKPSAWQAPGKAADGFGLLEESGVLVSLSRRKSRVQIPYSPPKILRPYANGRQLPRQGRSSRFDPYRAHQARRW